MYTCGRDSGSCHHTVTTDCNITADFTCTRHYVPLVCLAALVLWLCLWHSFLPPAFFSGRSLETSWAWRQPLTLVRCILVCAFSNSVLVSCAILPPPLPFFDLWTQLKEHSADSGTNLSHRVTHLHGCRCKKLHLSTDSHLVCSVWAWLRGNYQLT